MSQPSPVQWSEPQLDALRELANIGAGAAATQLYEQSGTLVRMHVPRSTVLVLPDRMDRFGDSEREVTAVLGQTGGDIRMLLALMLPTPFPMEPGAAATSAGAEAETADTANADDSLRTLGHGMCAAFVAAIAQTACQDITLTRTAVVTDMRGAVLESAVALAGDADAVLIVDTRLDIDGVPLPLTFLCLPQGDGVDRLLHGMGVGSSHPPEQL